MLLRSVKDNNPLVNILFVKDIIKTRSGNTMQGDYQIMFRMQGGGYTYWGYGNSEHSEEERDSELNEIVNKCSGWADKML